MAKSEDMGRLELELPQESTNVDLNELQNAQKYILEQQRTLNLLNYRRKKIVRKIQEITPHEEYVLYQIQPDGTVKMYQGIKAGIYTFKFTNQQGKEDEGLHILDESRLLSFPYGKQTYKGWFAHYKYAFPYPHSHPCESVTLERNLNKILAAEENYRAGPAWHKFVLYIIIGIVAALALYWFFGGKNTPPPTTIIIQNATQLATGAING